ncbi:MAG: hypothetical protein MUF38_07490 [Anaerolineae bacterium]|nr:hypothetical protein [Anaerolineae bacterium]
MSQKAISPSHGYVTLLLVVVAIVVGIIPIVGIINFVASHASVNFFMGRDEWITRLPVAILAAEGQLEFKHFFEQFGGTHHNIIFAQISVVLSTLLQNWSITSENYLTLLLAFVIVLLIVRVAYLYFDRSFLLAALTFALGAWLIFNAQSSVIWLSMVMSIRFHVILFFLIGLLILMSPNLTTGRVLLLAILGFWATFSASIGMMVWPAYFLVLLFHPARKTRYLVILIALGTLFTVLYVYVVSDTVLNTPRLQRSSLTNFVQLVPIMLGAPFSRYEFSTAIIFAVVGVLSYLVNVVYVFFRSGQLQPVIIPTSFAVFSLLTVVITSSGRNPTIQSGLYSWYVPQSIFFWLALLLLMLMVFRIYRANKPALFDHTIMVMNVGLVVAAGYFYLQTFQIQWDVDSQVDYTPLRHCARDYPFTLDGACFELPNFRNYRFDMSQRMQDTISNHLLLFNDTTLYPIPNVYEAGSVLWVNVSDPQKALLIRSAVLPQLLDEYKVTEQTELSALMSQIEATEQLWVIQEEDAPLPSFEMENAFEIIYQERILPDIPYQLIGYALR